MQVVVGRLGRPHGIKGELTIEVRTDEPDLRLAPGSVLLTEPTATGPLTITAARWHSGRLLVSVQGINDRSAAETLRGTVLIAEIHEGTTPDDPEEFYDRQLIGLRVVDTTGLLLGEISDVVHLPSQELLEVRRPDRPAALVPFVAEIVIAVDLASGTVTVDPPGGLFDLDLDTGSTPRMAPMTPVAPREAAEQTP